MNVVTKCVVLLNVPHPAVIETLLPDFAAESWPGARPMREEWVISVRDQCRDYGVPFFFKQWGGVRKKNHGRELDGRTYDEYPRRVAAPIPDRLRCAEFAEAILRSFGQVFRVGKLVQATT